MPSSARLNPKHDERTRAKIQTSHLINRLVKYVDGEIELTPTQVRAIEVLLKKTLPDLSAVQLDATHDVSDPVMELLKRTDGKTRDFSESG